MAKKAATRDEREDQYFSDGTPIPEEIGTEEEPPEEDDDFEQFVAALDQEDEEDYEIGMVSIRVESLRMAVEVIGKATGDLPSRLKTAHAAVAVARMYENYIVGVEE